MKIHFSRGAPLFLTGLICTLLGWSLHGLTTRGSAVSPASSGPLPEAQGGGPGLAGRLRSIDARSDSQRGSRAGVEAMVTTDPSDMLGMLEAIGAMTRMSDDQVGQAWRDLAGRSPAMSFGNSLSVLYLWARMRRLGEEVEIPPGWGAEQYQQAIDTELARGDLAELRQRLARGEPLSPSEKRAMLAEAMRKDPVQGIELWCRSTAREDYRNDARWLGDPLSDPAGREAVMARIREWQKGGDVAGVVSVLAATWISRDPAAVERWLGEPAQADVRDLLMKEIANSRALADPAQAWKWSQALSGQARLETLRTSAMQLAERSPAEGMELIAGLVDPAERNVAVQNFAGILAAKDFEQWQSWRDGLPAAEQAVANQSAFVLWVNKDVGMATAWLGAQPAGEARDAMVSTLVNYYAQRDPEACSTWIRTISDAERRREAAGAALSNVGPYDLEKIQIILNAAGR